MTDIMSQSKTALMQLHPILVMLFATICLVQSLSNDMLHSRSVASTNTLHSNTLKYQSIHTRSSILQYGKTKAMRPSPLYSQQPSVNNIAQQSEQTAVNTIYSHVLKSNLTRQLFCNVELNCEGLEAVGFDMDFTLAQYKESFDLLAFEGAKVKLVRTLGYPQEVFDFQYDSTAFRRGLIIDKKRGNILKVDRHKYVRKAFHGLSKEIPSKDRKALYSNKVTTFTESNYVNIDTLFHPIDAMLFCNMVEFKDNNPSVITKSYEEIYKDIRMCVDLCHRDGAIKDIVMKDPASYIIYDDKIVPLLQRLRRAGKKVFLLTNSMWEYTNRVMDFLVHGAGEYQNLDWKSLFDCVIVGACKPAFMIDNYLSLFLVKENGLLRNIDDNMVLSPSYLKTTAKVFQGGTWGDLHRMLAVSSGDKILYVGDHTYADILRSKRTLGWRTCLIIPELEGELQIAEREKDLYASLKSVRHEQLQLDDYINTLLLERDSGMNVEESLKKAEFEAMKIKDKLTSLIEEYNSKFNTKWGQLFKAGHQDSRFAKQVMDYACLYTSRASNLAYIYPNRIFRPIQDFMPHDIHDLHYYSETEDDMD